MSLTSSGRVGLDNTPQSLVVNAPLFKIFNTYQKTPRLAESSLAFPAHDHLERRLWFLARSSYPRLLPFDDNVCGYLSSLLFHGRDELSRNTRHDVRQVHDGSPTRAAL